MPARAGSSPARRRSRTGPPSRMPRAALRDSGLGVGAHLALVGHQGPVLAGPRGADAGRPPRAVWRRDGGRFSAGAHSAGSIPATCAASSPRRWRCSARTASPSRTSTRTRTFTSGRASRAPRSTSHARTTFRQSASRVQRDDRRLRSASATSRRGSSRARARRTCSSRTPPPGSTRRADSTSIVYAARSSGSRRSACRVPSSSVIPVTAPTTNSARSGGTTAGKKSSTRSCRRKRVSRVERAGFRLGTFADLATTRPVNRETRR